jgi:hypothetical protein
MTLQDTVSALLKKQVSEAEAMQFASKQFGILAGFLQDKALEEKFPNGFVSWSETYFEIILLLTDHLDTQNTVVLSPSEAQQRAHQWTYEFEKTFEGIEWDSIEYNFDEQLEMFMDQKLKTSAQ